MQTSPKYIKKYGKCGYKLIYPLIQSTTVNEAIFTKFKPVRRNF